MKNIHDAGFRLRGFELSALLNTILTYGSVLHGANGLPDLAPSAHRSLNSIAATLRRARTQPGVIHIGAHVRDLENLKSRGKSVPVRLSLKKWTMLNAVLQAVLDTYTKDDYELEVLVGSRSVIEPILKRLKRAVHLRLATTKKVGA
ncbi:MAG: hypothetical protein IT462_07280 [Planctomycetes bacterium]|nr:hypothetical protein [Planctomycetota bacterium]